MTFNLFSNSGPGGKKSRGTLTALSAAGLALILSACSSEAPAPKVNTVKPAVVETIEAVTPAPKYLTRLDCGGVGSAAGFQRSYVVYVEGGTLSFVKGFSGQSGYESWTGKVSADGSVDVEGTYEDTPGQPRPIAFTGSLTETSLDLSGTRGPRECTAVGKLPNA